jgi:hypothetical protein
MSSTIIFIIGSLLLGVSKAVADTVQHFDIWSQSIFSTTLETSFWGPKDHTWIRKDKNNKILNWLYHFPLVWITDIWHFANMIGAMSFVLLFGSIHYNQINIIVIILLFYISRTIGFNLFYHLILKKNEKKK